MTISVCIDMTESLGYFFMAARSGKWEKHNPGLCCMYADRLSTKELNGELASTRTYAVKASSAEARGSWDQWDSQHQKARIRQNT